MSWTVDGLTYPTRRKITIQVAELLDGFSDFPVLVKLTSSNFNFEHSNSDGFDIRFTSSDGSTLLKYERLRHDSVNSLAEYWVKIPTISAIADTDFYIYYRTDDTSNGEDKANVWTNGFVAVWHLNGSYNGTVSEVLDSTGDVSHYGTASSAPTQVDGKVSKAQEFNGSDDGNYLTMPSLSELDYQGEFTIECLATTDGNGGEYRTLWDSGDYFDLRHSNANNSLQQTNFNTKNPTIAADSVSTGTWYHLAFTWFYDVTNGNGYLYQNGEQKDSTEGDTFSGALSGNLYIGEDNAFTGTNSRNWDGKVEEFRISSVARSEEWLNATYKSCFDLLNVYGAMEGYPTFASSFTETVVMAEGNIQGPGVVLSDIVSIVEGFLKRKFTGWVKKSKNTTTFSNKTKNTTTFNNKSKNITTWTYRE